MNFIIPSILSFLVVVCSTTKLGNSSTYKIEVHRDDFGTYDKREQTFVTAMDDNGDCQVYTNVKQTWTGKGEHNVAENLNGVTKCYRTECNVATPQEPIDCGEFTRVSGEVAA